MIPFTQYIRPDGREGSISIERPEAIEMMARTIIEKDGYFEAEVLTTKQISLTAETEDEEGEIKLLAIELCENNSSTILTSNGYFMVIRNRWCPRRAWCQEIMIEVYSDMKHIEKDSPTILIITTNPVFHL